MLPAALSSQRAAAPGAAPVLLAAGDSSGGALLLQFLLALTQRRYTPPGAEDLVQAALAFAPYTEPLLCLGPSYVTIAWCADPQWGVATGDPDYASPRMPFSQAWAEHRDRMRGWLRGNGSDGGGAAPPLDAVDWAVANPLWAPPEVLRQLPPLTIQVGAWGLCCLLGRGCLPAFPPLRRPPAAAAVTHPPMMPAAPLLNRRWAPQTSTWQKTWSLRSGWPGRGRATCRWTCTMVRLQRG